MTGRGGLAAALWLCLGGTATGAELGPAVDPDVLAPQQSPEMPTAETAAPRITAIDAGGDCAGAGSTVRVSGRAVDLAAPGVDVRVPGIERYLTGASHAAPFVSAALALAPDPSVLHRGARDLGEAGRDPVFGHGLVQFEGLCPG